MGESPLNGILRLPEVGLSEWWTRMSTLRDNVKGKDLVCHSEGANSD